VTGKAVRALAQENHKAFALLNSLNPSQRAAAILKYQISDLVLGPERNEEMIALKV